LDELEHRYPPEDVPSKHPYGVGSPQSGLQTASTKPTFKEFFNEAGSDRPSRFVKPSKAKSARAGLGKGVALRPNRKGERINPSRDTSKWNRVDSLGRQMPMGRKPKIDREVSDKFIYNLLKKGMTSQQLYKALVDAGVDISDTAVQKIVTKFGFGGNRPKPFDVTAVEPQVPVSRHTPGRRAGKDYRSLPRPDRLDIGVTDQELSDMHKSGMTGAQIFNKVKQRGGDPISSQGLYKRLMRLGLASQPKPWRTSWSGSDA